MPLIHKEPVIVQRVYVKPSATDRLRSLFASRRHARPYPPSRPVPPRRTYARRPPAYRGGLFGRRHRQYVTTPHRRHHRRPSAWMRFKYSLIRPRRTMPGATAVPAARPHRVRRQHHHSKIAALLALLTLRNRRHGYPHHHHRHLFRRHHRVARPVGAPGYVY